MTYMTIDNWQHELTSKGLSHNDTVRLLQDAQEQIDALKTDNNVLRAELKKLQAELREERGYLAMEWEEVTG